MCKLVTKSGQDKRVDREVKESKNGNAIESVRQLPADG